MSNNLEINREESGTEIPFEGEENPKATRKILPLIFTREIELDLLNSPTHLVIKQALSSSMETPATVHKRTWEDNRLFSVERNMQT